MEEKEQYKHIKQSLEKAALQPTENDWHDMEALLDTHLPTGEGGGGGLPKAPGSFFTYTAAIIIAVITIVAVVMYTTQKTNDTKTAVNNTAALHADNDSINSKTITGKSDVAEKNNGDNNISMQQKNINDVDSSNNANGNTQQKNNTTISTVPGSTVNTDNVNGVTGKQQQSNTVNGLHDGATDKNTTTGNSNTVAAQTIAQRAKENKSNDQQKKTVTAKDSTAITATQKGKAGLLLGNNRLNSGDTKSIKIVPGEAVTKNSKDAQQKNGNTSIATILQQPNTMAYSNNLFDPRQSGALTGSLYKKETDTINKFNYAWKGGSFTEDMLVTNFAANKSADSIHQNLFVPAAHLQTIADAQHKKATSKNAKSGAGGNTNDDKTFQWGLQLSPLQFNLVNGSSNQATTFNYIPGLFGQLHLNSKLTAGVEILPFARNGISNSTYFSNSSSVVSDSGSTIITTKTKSAYTASLLNTFKGGIHLNYKLSDNLSAEAVAGVQMPYSGKAIRVDSSFQFVNADSSFTGSSSTNIRLKKSDPSFNNINSSTFYAGFMLWYTQNKFSLGVGYQQNLQGWFKNTTPNPASKQFQITLRYYIK